MIIIIILLFNFKIAKKIMLKQYNKLISIDEFWVPHIHL
jgi:hypothetical protein